MSMITILGSVETGLIFAIMSLGIYITFTILNFPDLTVDGSFTLGCVISALFAFHGHPILGVFLAMMAGGIAGLTTGFLHTKLKVQYILSGILTMTALYSINLKIADGKPNFSLFGKDTIFSLFENFLIRCKLNFLTPYSEVLLSFLLTIVALGFLYLFFKTQCGMAIRATGDNEKMVRASSINTDAMKMLGLAIANAYVSLSAAIFAQYQLFYDISLGIGMMVVGLTSIILGETIFGKRNLLNSFISLVLGAIIYRLLLSFALYIGMNPNDWKLMCALLVAFAISLPTIKTYFMKRGVQHARH